MRVQTLHNRNLGENPVFLVGSERSGTTLLRLMLDHHPEIAFNRESDFLVTHISESGEFPDVTEYRQALESDRIFRDCGFAMDESLDFASLVTDFLRQRRDQDGKRIVGATVHHGFRRLKYIWPEARYIYLLRDGRDVASSVVQMGWAGNEYVAANWWLDAEAEWSELRKELDPSQWIEIRYEDLTADTVGQLSTMCNFIGVEYDDRMLDYVNTSTYSAPDPRNNHKWRNKMAVGTARLVEARIGRQLARRGYALSSEPVLHVSVARDKWLRLHSRLGALRYRMATYGVRLVLLEFLSRKCRWSAVNRSARRAIDRVAIKYLK